MNYCFDALLEFLVETNFVDLGLREKVQTLIWKETRRGTANFADLVALH